VVLCVFDTLNHVTQLSGWRDVVRVAFNHLAPGGLFIFDLHTLGRLRELSQSAAWVHDFDGHTLIMSVESHDPLADWDIRIFENCGTHYQLHHERISELGVELSEVRHLLSPYFEVLDESDPDGSPASDESERVYYCVRRLSV
jgi:hypothetical protein